jgi:tetratricopeptide (TPR) repeat protein
MRPTALFLLAVITRLSAAQQATPAPTDTRLARADSLFLARDFKNALRIYAEAAAAAPLDNRSRYRYAMSLTNSGNHAAAAPILDQAAVNGNPIVLYNAGSVHARLGHADTAFAYLNMSIAGGFSNLQILSADSGFMRLKSDARYAAAEKRLRDAFTPCVANPDSRKFDFWVGEWNVVNAVGQPAGTSSVQKILGECVVFENWTDAQGGQGKSLNAFNRQLGRWQQFWMDQYGNVTEYRESSWEGPSLRYVADALNRQGQPVKLRMTFTPIDANTVRQFGETSTDGGKTWTTGYDLTYRRKK